MRIKIEFTDADGRQIDKPRCVSFEKWAADNADYMAEGDAAKISRILMFDTFEIGGGSAPLVTLTRV